MFDEVLMFIVESYSGESCFGGWIFIWECVDVLFVILCLGVIWMVFCVVLLVEWLFFCVLCVDYGFRFIIGLYDVLSFVNR